MRSISRSSLLWMFVVLSFAAPAVWAQTRVDPSRAADAAAQAGIGRSLFSNALSNSGGEDTLVPESPGDSDLGDQVLLKRSEKAEPFTAWIDSSLFWTDNAANVGATKAEDYFYVGGVNLSWQERLAGRFYGDAYVGQHWYQYDADNRLNYDIGEVRLGMLAALPEFRDAILSLHYGYQRITDGIDNNALYEAHVIRLGLQKTFLIDRVNSVNIGLLSSFAAGTSPDLLQRHEHALQLGYNLKFSPRTNLSLSYRLSYFDYFNFQGREDWYQNLGASLNFVPCRNFEVSLGYYFAVNSSSNAFFDYQTQLGGFSLAAKIRF